MFFSNKEKKFGSSKILSEAEIKKKLYGEFDLSSSATHVASEVKTTTSTYESHAAKPTVKSPSFGATSKPEVLTSRLPSSASFPDSAPRKPFTSAATGTDWKKATLKTSQAVLGFLAGILWKLGSYLIQALDFVLRILDPRKPQARKLLYSITACILVAALFFGVFRLNAQRKKAMMGELKTTVVAEPVASKPSAVTTVAALPIVNSENTASVQETKQPTIAKTEAVEPISAAPTVAQSGKYVIQVATYAGLEDANRVIQSITQAGFTAFYKKQIRNSTGHVFYPVYLGRFETFALAQQNLSKFRKASVARPFQDSFIRTLE